MAKKTEQPALGWLTKKQMAAVFDVSTGVFDDNYRRFAPATAQKTIGGALYFHARTVLDGWAASQAARKVGMPEDADPLLLGGGDSPALEEYRRHAAREKKVKADMLEGIALRADHVEPMMLRAAEPLRRAGEELVKRFGNEAGEIHNQGVEGWVEGVRTYLGNAREPVTESV